MNTAIHYDYILRKLRHFFQTEKGFIEVPAHCRPSLLTTCGEPKTISHFSSGGIEYPLAQTGHMWLEYELLKNPSWKGVFCVGPSFRDEQCTPDGRHQKIFPMFEFAAPGSSEQLAQIQIELLQFLGFESPYSLSYENACTAYNTAQLTEQHEIGLYHECGPVVCVNQFPSSTEPFWNIKQTNEGLFNKQEIILYGMKTMSTAERSSDKASIRDRFFTYLGGTYAQHLFERFGQDRVVSELDDYLALPMFPRCGGSIGITRLEHALKKAYLLEPSVLLTNRSHHSGQRTSITA